MDQDYLALLHKTPIPIHPISTLSRVKINTINPSYKYSYKFHSIEKQIFQNYDSKARIHRTFLAAREIESALTRSFTLFPPIGKSSCLLREQSVETVSRVVRRRYPHRTTPPPRSKSLSAIRTYSAHVNPPLDRREGNNFLPSFQ